MRRQRLRLELEHRLLLPGMLALLQLQRRGGASFRRRNLITQQRMLAVQQNLLPR